MPRDRIARLHRKCRLALRRLPVVTEREPRIVLPGREFRDRYADQHRHSTAGFRRRLNGTRAQYGPVVSRELQDYLDGPLNGCGRVCCRVETHVSAGGQRPRPWQDR